jgi:predicted patatin/cPLA2 family phospholipase
MHIAKNLHAYPCLDEGTKTRIIEKYIRDMDYFNDPDK